jgi:hypothetical protein
MRDRLIEILREPTPIIRWYDLVGESRMSIVDAERYADHLLKNGVIVPPYKCGTVVYVVRSQTSNGKNLYIRKEQIEQYRTSNNGTFMTFESGRVSVRNDEWSRCVFATLEEAERALKGEHNAEIH